MKSSIFTLWSLSLLSLSAEPLPLASAYWKDPSFLKSFNGSYRIEANIEPYVSQEERAVLIQIQAFMSQGKRDQALKTLASHELTEASPALTYNLANLYFEVGEIDQSITAYQKAIKEYPSFRRAHRNLAMALIQKNQLSEALPHLTEALRLGDADGTTYGLLGYCWIHKKEFASALQAYRMAGITEPHVAEWKAGIAQCLQEFGNKEEAVSLMQEVVAMRPEEGSYSLLLSQLQLADGQSAEAQKSLEFAHRIGSLSADGILLLAEFYLFETRAEEAKNLLNLAFQKELKPSISAIVNLSNKAIHQNQWPLMKTVLSEAKQYVDSSLLKRAEARYLILSEQDPAAGASILESLIGNDPTDAASLFALAQYKIQKQELDHAELLLERASVDPDHAHNALIELAKIRVQTSRFMEAVQSLDSALKIQFSESIEKYRQAVKAAADAAN